MPVSIRKTFEGIRKGKDEAKKTIAMIVSDASIDRDEEIILPASFLKRLEHYRANPIVVWNHPLGCELAPPEYLIGRSLSTDVVTDGLLADMQFAVDQNPTARLIWELANADFLKAVSVGAGIWDFVSYWDTADRMQSLQAMADGPAAYHALQEGAAWRVFTESELWEISWTYAGSNRNAINRALAEGVITKNTLHKLAGFHHLTSPVREVVTKVIETEAPATPPEVPAATAAAPASEVVTLELTEDEKEEAEFEALLASDPELKDALVEILAELIFDESAGE